MMDHALRTISYIADIGDLVVLMARRRVLPTDDAAAAIQKTPKMICHVFESDEVSDWGVRWTMVGAQRKGFCRWSAQR